MDTSTRDAAKKYLITTISLQPFQKYKYDGPVKMQSCKPIKGLHKNI